VEGKQMGPYHHYYYYCKVLAPDPVIQCLIYESTEPNARLSQVEFIMAKKLTRTCRDLPIPRNALLLHISGNHHPGIGAHELDLFAGIITRSAGHLKGEVSFPLA
jgi:hypothetical protein